MPSAIVEPSKRTPRKRSARSIDREKTLALAKAGVPIPDIARHQGVARTTVWRFLQQYKDQLTAIDIYKANRADMLAGLQGDCFDLQKRIIATFDDGILSALKPHEKTGLLMALNSTHGTVFDKERLERGQSTANVSLIGRMMGGAFESAHKTTTDSGVKPEIAEQRSDT